MHSDWPAMRPGVGRGRGARRRLPVQLGPLLSAARRAGRQALRGADRARRDGRGDRARRARLAGHLQRLPQPRATSPTPTARSTTSPAGARSSGIGAGWFEKDFDEYGYDFGTVGTRLTALEEALPRIEARMGKLNPPPVRQPIPILIGGGGVKRTLKLVARHANIWHAFGSPDVCREKSAILAEHCANEGRDPAEIEISWGAQGGEWDDAARGRRHALHPRRLRQRLGLRPRPAARARRVEGRAVIIDESTEFGARVAEHLRTEIVVWMTTVTPSGAPLPMPVWFLWEGGESVRDVQQGEPARAQPRGEPERVAQLRRRRARRRDRRAIRPRDGRPRRPARERGRRLHREVRRPTSSGSPTRPSRSAGPTRSRSGSSSRSCEGTDHSPGGGPGQARSARISASVMSIFIAASFRARHSAVSATANVARVQNT